ncbi:MAG: Hpt domain-containing protein, partial [Planctomycetota bacterium]
MIRPLVAAKEYLLLPDRISKFEHGYLLRLNRIATILFLCHLPVFIAIAYFNETGPLLATALTSAVLLGPLLASRVFQSQRAISVVHGFTMVLMCGLLIHFCQGPIQIEMHFYFFVGCTLLSVFGNPMVILAALLAIAVHHFGLFYLLPESAWNYEPSVLVLMTHIVFAALAAASGVFNSRTFYNSIVQLEQRVDEQTKVVGARNRDIGMILQSVEQGFLTIERDGRVHHERSASVDRLLGEIGPDETLIEAVARHDEKFASWLEFGLGEVFEGVLPPEVAVDQLPTQLTANGRILSLQSYPLLVDDTVSNLKVVVTDVTAELEKQKLETETREMLSLIDRYATDPNGVIEFFRESGKIIEELRSESRDDVVLVRRRLHTLKGNAATFGLTRLSDCCHSLEDENFELQATSRRLEWLE